MAKHDEWQTGTLISVRRLNCTSMGNPRYELGINVRGERTRYGYVESFAYFTTQSNASVAYDIENLWRECRGRAVDYRTTRYGRVWDMRRHIPLPCAYKDGCECPVSHIDNKGYIYCDAHGSERNRYVPCRQMTKQEVETLRQGKGIAF